MTAFASLVLDVDSTISGVEGLDWIARQRGAGVTARVEELTAASMDGGVALDKVYGSRLALVKPSLTDIEALAAVYLDRIDPGVQKVVARAQAAGVRVVLVSGGIRTAILPLASALGIDARDVHAVEVKFDERGGYIDFDRGSPLTTQNGKLPVIRSLGLPRPILFVGDGSTDLAARPAVDAFAAFTGFVTRPAVVAAADHVISDFGQVESLVIGEEPG